MVKLYKNFNIDNHHKNSIILIGNFDGLHLGHQKLFKLALSYKKKNNSFFWGPNLIPELVQDLVQALVPDLVWCSIKQ